MSKITLLILILITFVGLIIRIYKITSSPAGLYVDETSIGYNAYSIITTGRDEHGKFMPLFFEAFGEYKLPVYIYAVAATQLFTGPTDLSVRLPSVIFGILTIPLIFLLSKELLKNNPNLIIKNLVPPLSAFLLATSPWHFQFTRPGFEASAGLFFLILGLFAIFKAVRENSAFILVISILSFVLTLYSYNSARIVIPVILLTLFILYLKKFSLESWFKVFLIGGIIALPFIIFSASPEGLARAKQVSIFFQQNQNSIARQFLLNYWANISPFYLFMKGDPTIAHLTPYRMGLLYLIETPFFFLGLFMLILKRSKAYFVILILFLVSAVPPAISTLSPHALRATLILPATVFISALGFGYFLEMINNKNIQKVILGLYILIISISTLRFLNIYHNKYAINAGRDWQVGIKGVTQRILEIENNYDNVYFDEIGQKVSILWYLKYDPRIYQATYDKNGLGKYHFGINSWELIPNTGRNLYVTYQTLSSGRLLDYIYYPNGTVAYGIWEF